MNVPLYVTHPAAVLRRQDGRILVTVDGELRASVPVKGLSEVVLLGPANVTTQALCALLAEGVPVVFLRSDGRARGRLEPPDCANIERRREQMRRSEHSEQRQLFASWILSAKLANQRVAVQRLARRNDQSSDLRAKLEVLAKRIDAARASLDPSQPLPSQLGYEGTASAAYFHALRLCGGAAVKFERRERHETDPLNVLLNYTSALLRESVVGAIVAAGLDPQVGFLHETSRGRPSFAFDLMEEWRPVLSETVALACVGLQIVRRGDLEAPREPGSAPRLSPAARARVVERYAARLATAVTTQPGADTYRDLLFRQAIQARDWIGGLRERYEGFRWK